MKIGNIDVIKGRIGNTEVSKMYLGDVEVFSAEKDYTKEYLTFEIVSAGTIATKTYGSIGSKTIQYSVNKGPWLSFSSGSAATSVTVITNVSVGDKVRFKGTNSTYARDKSNYMCFEGGTATFNLSGNIMSLTGGDAFVEVTSLPGDYTFCSMFKYAHCLSAENLVFPILTLREGCYRAMFSFADLTVAPKILPATTLAQYCYWYMFEQCKFTTAPELPYTGKLPTYSYGNMFTDCPNLNYVKCLATDVTASNATQSWLKNVSSTGTFVKNPNMSGWSRGVNGIPTNWTVIDDDSM